ncbi:MAG: hypothetical protein F9K34_00455 [Albidovulum sp.]|uniref:hypothetical protein n=1 Tax=Albidovulum sp. TaxID=1872424 RepID=UPI00132329A9|nr:hypothetical protein [Defluviimonas sp.]KAB2886883.1 MAG: hypothetical protein F9K34_00455 [Defluviimonas sp.]
MPRPSVSLSLAAMLAAPAAFGAGITSPADPAKRATFDILAAEASRDGDAVTFRMTLAATAGSEQPAPVGALAGAPVHAYVWPTSLDPATVGFEGGTGVLALAATSHPDFDDTPLEDEDGDGDPKNDGGPWHSHWVVLTPSEECGPGALSVRDIPEGETPALPKTWPGLPLFIDSPGYVPALDADTVAVTVTLPGAPADIGFDGVTSALRVNANVHAPLLCVTDVFDVASGDLSLPGKVE